MTEKSATSKKEIIKEDIVKIEKVGKSLLEKLGFPCFLIGVETAIISGLVIGYRPEILTMDLWGYVATLLALLGFLIGLLSAAGLGGIPTRNVDSFLVVTIALVVIGAGSEALRVVPLVGPYLAGITLSMLILFAPAAVILALKVRWDIIKIFKRATNARK
jgi:hypothetical protein